MSAPGHRIQNIEHHVPNQLQRSGWDAFGQIQNEAPRPETVLFEHGGDREEGWSKDSLGLGR